MKILVDENIDPPISEMLESDGYEVEIVHESQMGNSDSNLLTYSTLDQSVLLTADRDFGELVFRLGMAHSGVVYLRLDRLSIAARLPIIRKVFQDNGTDLLTAFTTVKPNRVTIRKRKAVDPMDYPESEAN